VDCPSRIVIIELELVLGFVIRGVEWWSGLFKLECQLVSFVSCKFKAEDELEFDYDSRGNDKD
jgi:hypothetical protein